MMEDTYALSCTQVCGEDGADETHCLDLCSGYEVELPDVDEFRYRYYTVSIFAKTRGSGQLRAHLCMRP